MKIKMTTGVWLMIMAILVFASSYFATDTKTWTILRIDAGLISLCALWQMYRENKKRKE